MGQQEYLIGDMAAITGLSRDTLRFYEKKGILNARKKPNGYRYFTEEDLYLLVHVLFSRKLNFDLDTTRELLPRTPLCSRYQETLKRQMEEELKAIQFHRQALDRLLSMEKLYDGMGECLNRFCLKTFPASRILIKTDSPSEGLRQWFLLSRQHPGLDMVYIYDCYQYCSGFSLQEGAEDSPGDSPEYEAELAYKYSLLVLYEDVIDTMKLDCDLSGSQTFSLPFCIHTSVEVSDVRPELSLILAMRSWAREQDLLASSDIFVTSNFAKLGENGPFYCQQIYIPLLSSEEDQ